MQILTEAEFNSKALPAIRQVFVKEDAFDQLVARIFEAYIRTSNGRKNFARDRCKAVAPDGAGSSPATVNRISFPG